MMVGNHAQYGICTAIAVMMLSISASASGFEAQRFVAEHTSFIEDFGELRDKWFRLETEVFGIEEIDAPVDWGQMVKRSKDLVGEHETLMRNILTMSRRALDTVPSSQADEAAATRRTILGYIDAAGLLILKLHEICTSLAGKTRDPYSYTMSEYNRDIDQYRQLYTEFQRLGADVNTLFYDPPS